MSTVAGSAATTGRHRMFSERTSVGLDVHARTTTAWALNGETGEVFSERLDAETHNVLAWVATLPQPAAVAYEAGPTGFVLARALDGIGIRCVVAAPSKMERPAGDRIKTDKRDAQRLAKLLRMDELPVVRVPTPAEEAARDLVRGRDDVRRDLARARNRVSKLLLRQGRVWRGQHPPCSPRPGSRLSAGLTANEVVDLQRKALQRTVAFLGWFFESSPS
ncbi:IS110 family transposase [Streptomyces chiangmaiensis]